MGDLTLAVPQRGFVRAPSLIAAACCVVAVLASRAGAQGVSTSLLASRAELTAEASKAESAASVGAASMRTRNAINAAAIRQRLRDGDLQVGDLVEVSFISDAVHRDTLVVKPGRTIELSGMAVVPVTGMLRSEVSERLSAVILGYVKAQQIEITPLIRLGILGAVARPGYFALAPDIPLTRAIMAAGGPTTAADVDRAVVRRRNQELHSSNETRRAIADGLTIDQFGLSAGDELIVGERTDFSGKLLGTVGALASVLAVVVALRR